MDPRRAHTERNMLPQVGASFFRDGDTVMFQFIIDPGNVLGPRPATRADQTAHAGAWAAFIAAEGVSALDRDATGGEGGSLPAESPAAVAVQAPAADSPKDWLADEFGPGARTHNPFRAFDDDMEAQRSALEAPAEQPRQKRKYTRRKVN